jgi:AcrR family transcriptional regulator
LRKRKKRRTRALIADTARRLFFERGFEATTVSEVARAAEVAEQMVFNYFSTREDLFYIQKNSRAVSNRRSVDVSESVRPD